LAEYRVPSEKNEGKGSGSSKLLQIGFVVLGLIAVLQVLGAFGDSFEGFTIRCCVGLFVVIILVAVFVFRCRGKRAEERESEPQIVEVSEAEAAYERGEQLLSQGKREEAVAAYLQAYREGEPTARRLALSTLKKLGEIEEF
jgi:hypothetical protein